MNESIPDNIRQTYVRGVNRYGLDTVSKWFNWYDAYAQLLADIALEHEQPIERVTGAFAWLSPRSTVTQNVSNLIALLEGQKPKHTEQFINRASSVLAGDMSSLELGPHTRSRKVRSFYRNLLGDETYVTLDIWAARAAGFNRQPERQLYLDIESAYRLVAIELNTSPARLQAAVWSIVRGTDE